MRILFVHQNMPAQYAHLATYYAKDPSNEIVFVTRRKRFEMPGVRKVLYDLPRESKKDLHHYIHFLDEQILYGQSVARSCLDLRREGFIPDVICAHSGWGESLFLKEVYPEVPVLVFAEFFYRGSGADVGFAEGGKVPLDQLCKLRMRNIHLITSLELADWAVTPTIWQWKQQPAAFRPRMSVIHDGVRTGLCTPDPQARLALPNGRILSQNDEVVTYLARNLEPYRGFDVFMHALPELLKRRPKAHVILVGGDDVSYGGKPAEAKSWREKMQKEISIDPDRVHFIGRVPYNMYLSALRITRVHTYLTYPFVLSWSMLEAMSAECCLVASATAPVQEVITDGENGVLVDFFDTEALVGRICELLDDPERRERLGKAARKYIVENYDLETVCLPQHIELVDRVAKRQFPKFSSSAYAESFPGAPPEEG